MIVKAPKRYDTAVDRWAGLGPYYAMFPVDFADRVIREYTKEGDYVIDPFAGRATAIFSAATQGRKGLGIEINPVGWVYGRAKLQPADEEEVEEQIRWLGSIKSRYRAQASSLPKFFKRCFSPAVREFLLAARTLLDWRRRQVDWTTMALILVYLHGKRDNSLSNQMRQTKAMSPQYSILWWEERDLSPPQLDPVDFLLKKVEWRYDMGCPEMEESRLYLGDSRSLLGRLARHDKPGKAIRAKLLFTSPPYCGVTNYFYDQWLRLWMLGGPPRPRRLLNSCKGKFVDKESYLGLLRSVFSESKHLLDPKATLYIRTDARQFTRDSTLAILKEVFPNKRMKRESLSLPSFTQTSLFDTNAETQGEIDLVFE